MANITFPYIRTYAQEEVSGAIAEFSSAKAEYLKVEKFGRDIGVNWTTNLGAVSIADVMEQTLVSDAEVEVWHWDKIDKFDSKDKNPIIKAIESSETIRLTYEIKPDAVSANGMIIAWRIRNNRVLPPYQLGTLDRSDYLSFSKGLMLHTATTNVKTQPHLADWLLNQV